MANRRVAYRSTSYPGPGITGGIILFLRNGEGRGKGGLFGSTWIFNYGDKFVRGVNKKFNSGEGENIGKLRYRSVLF